jgi:methyl-accepting chemotaxis protein
MRKINLQNRFILLIGSLFLLTIAGLIFYFTSQIHKDLLADALRQNELTSANYASLISKKVDVGVDAARTMAQIFSNYPEYEKTKRRLLMNEMLKNLIKDNPDFLCAWTVWEPNVLDGADTGYKNKKGHDATGRFVPSWYRNGAQIKLQPCFDYTIEGAGDYYLIPKKTAKEYITDPFYYSYTGDKKDQQLVISLAIPIITNGKFVGVAGIDISVDYMQKYLEESGVVSGIFSNNGITAADVDKKRIGTQMAETEKDVAGEHLTSWIEKIKKGEAYTFQNYIKNMGQDFFISSSPMFFGKSDKAWTYATAIPSKQILAPIKVMVATSLIIGIVLLIGLYITLFFIVRSIIAPIKKTIAFAERLSEGDLNATIDIKRNDEVGQLAIALRRMAEKLREVVENIISSANQIANASKQISSSSQQLSQGANESAASTEQVSSSMEQMVSNINQNADNAKQTEIIALRASSDIAEGSNAVITTVEAMKKIADKISIVGAIAEKTDLLAINAAIEAARAGEHGKGFAVVASEVRKLSERSQIAAKEIDELSKSSVRIAENSGQILQKIVPDIQKTATLVQEIAAASIEQNSGSYQINNAITQLSQVTQVNATASEEMSSNAEELSAQAEILRDLVSFFTLTSNNEPATFRQKNNDSVIKKTNQAKDKSKETFITVSPEQMHDNKKVASTINHVKVDEHYEEF